MVSLAHPSFGLELIFHNLPTTEFAVLSKNNVTKDYKTVVPKLYWYITILMIFEHEITNKMWKKGVVTINMNIQLQCFFEKSVTCCYY